MVVSSDGDSSGEESSAKKKPAHATVWYAMLNINSTWKVVFALAV